MRRDVMLLFLSDVKLNADGSPVKPFKYKNIGYGGPVHTTNESAVFYLMNSDDEPKKLSRLFLLETKLVTTPIKAQDTNELYQDKEGRSWTHRNYFLKRIQKAIPNVAEIVEHISFDELSDPERALSNLLDAAGTIREYAEDFRREAREAGEKAELVLHVDVTGGMRNANMMMMALLRILQYESIEIGKVLYSDPKIGLVEEEAPVYNAFNLVAGAEEFVRFGSVRTLRDYFKKETKREAVSGKLKNLQDAMNGFDEQLRLCHYGDLRAAIGDLHKALTDFDDEGGVSEAERRNDRLMLQMKGRVERDYAPILKDELDDIALIRWCVGHGLYQQAMTLVTERVPEILYQAGFYHVAEEAREDFEAELAADSMNRSEAFFLLNAYEWQPARQKREKGKEEKRGETEEKKAAPAPSENPLATLHSMRSKAEKAWGKEVEKALQLVKKEEATEADFRSSISRQPAALAAYPYAFVADADEAVEVLLALHRLNDLSQPEQTLDSAPLRHLLTELRSRLAKKDAYADNLARLETTLANWRRGSGRALVKILIGSLRAELRAVLAPLVMDPVLERSVLRRVELRDEALGRDILLAYDTIKEERNTTNHAHVTEGGTKISALRKRIDGLLANLERAVGEDKGGEA